MRQNTYHPQTAKFIAKVCESMPKLSGEVMQGWIQNPMALQKVLREALSPDGKSAREFPAWKTITLGTFGSVKDLRKALEDGGFRVSDWASNLLGQPGFTLATEEIEVNLVKTTVVELGFPKGATLQEIYDRALGLGLKLCPAEVGPRLRLQYGDQPYGGWIIVATEPIADSGGYPDVFSVAHDGGARWLDADWRGPDGFWSGGIQFVFVSPSTRE